MSDEEALQVVNSSGRTTRTTARSSDCSSTLQSRTFQLVSLLVVSLVAVLLMQKDAVANTLHSTPRSTSVIVYKDSHHQSTTTVSTTTPGAGGNNNHGEATLATTPYDDRPYFILHVGPQKTGTSFIQQTICGNTTTEMLLEDGYFLLGMCQAQRQASRKKKLQRKGAMQRMLGNNASRGKKKLQRKGAMQSMLGNNARRGQSDLFFDHKQTYANLPAMANVDLLEHILEAKSTGQGLILSDENLSHMSSKNIAALAAVLNPIFRVRVIVTYRRFYEWIPSWHNQFYRAKKRQGQDVPWELTSGLGSGLPFDLDDRPGTSGIIHDVELLQQHPTQMLRNKFAQFFPDVAIMNLHDLPVPPPPSSSNSPNLNEDIMIDPTLHYFLCSMIPHATHTCRAVEEGIIHGSTKGNPSWSFDYDLVAMAAYKKGWINPQAILRKEAGVMIRQHNGKLMKSSMKESKAGKTLDDFPQECLSAVKLQRLLELSLMGERNLFGSKVMTIQEEEHRRGFEEFKSKLCWLNTTSVLDDPEWRSFLKSLYSSQ